MKIINLRRPWRSLTTSPVSNPSNSWASCTNFRQVWLMHSTPICKCNFQRSPQTPAVIRWLEPADLGCRPYASLLGSNHNSLGRGSCKRAQVPNSIWTFTLAQISHAEKSSNIHKSFKQTIFYSHQNQILWTMTVSAEIQAYITSIFILLTTALLTACN